MPDFTDLLIHYISIGLANDHSSKVQKKYKSTECKAILNSIQHVYNKLYVTCLALTLVNDWKIITGSYTSIRMMW